MKTPQHIVDDWNEKHPIGTPVTRYKLINPLREPQQTRTRSEAWVMGGHSAVVKVEGVAGGVLVESVVPQPAAAPASRHAFLEETCLTICRSLKASGVLMLILHQNNRAEVIAALQEQQDDLPGRLRRLADEIESGSGMPLGAHGSQA